MVIGQLDPSRWDIGNPEMLVTTQKAEVGSSAAEALDYASRPVL